MKDPGQFPRNKTLVFICRSGHRSLMAARSVAAKGRVAYSVKGGMLAWNSLSDQRQVAEPAGAKPDREKNTIPLKKDDGPDSIEEDMGC